jgi:hypothetical protein
VSTAERRPQVNGAPDSLFGPIIEVVPERWSHLALELNGRHKTLAIHHEHIPYLRGAEVAWEREHPTFQADVCVPKAVKVHNVLHQSQEAVHVLPCRDPGALPSVSSAALDLLLACGLAVSPECLDRFGGLGMVVSQINARWSSPL